MKTKSNRCKPNTFCGAVCVDIFLYCFFFCSDSSGNAKDNNSMDSMMRALQRWGC